VRRALFVCIGNAGRSQMAQAFYEQLGGEARSAGSRPEEKLHGTVVEAMHEVGVDISDRRPKGFTHADVEWADVIVTMGCGDVCPVFPGRQYLDWDLPDPVAMDLDDVRVLRDEIQQRIAALAR
jgi:arsenate reductase (thioredoxin)